MRGFDDAAWGALRARRARGRVAARALGGRRAYAPRRSRCSRRRSRGGRAKRRSKLSSKAVRRALPRRAPSVSLPDPFARLPPFAARPRAALGCALTLHPASPRGRRSPRACPTATSSAAASARRAPVRRRAAGALGPAASAEADCAPTANCELVAPAERPSTRRPTRRPTDARRRFVSRARGVALVAQDFAATPRLAGRSASGCAARTHGRPRARGFVATRAKGGGRSPRGLSRPAHHTGGGRKTTPEGLGRTRSPRRSGGSA